MDEGKGSKVCGGLFLVFSFKVYTQYHIIIYKNKNIIIISIHLVHEVGRREGIRGLLAALSWRATLRCRDSRVKRIRQRRGSGRQGRQEAAGLNDAVFGQVAELHVAEGFPWAHHCDVSAKTFHAGDVVTKAGKQKPKR